MKRLTLCVFLFASHVNAQDVFSFKEDPTAGMSSTKLTLPPKKGSALSLNSSSDVQGNRGDATYSYAFVLPAWRGLLSGLTLSYNSQNGFGVAGQGFDLSNPFIERTQSFGVPEVSTPFRASDDGDLIPLGKENFRSRIEKSFKNYLYRDSVWTVFDGRGRVYRYGLDANSQESEGGLTSRWWLTEIEDPGGYKVRFVYTKNGTATSYLSRVLFIDGLRTRSPSVTFAAQIDYLSLRPEQQWTSFRSGVRRRIDQVVAGVSSFWIGGELNEINASSVDLGQRFPSTRISRMTLSYIEAGPLLRPQISRIEQWGKTDDIKDKMPMEKLRYSPICPGSPECGKNISVKYKASTDISFIPSEFKWIDANSDGVPDLVGRSDDGKWKIFVNQTIASQDDKLEFEAGKPLNFPLNSFLSPVAATLDVNGDRRLDLLISDDLDGKVSSWTSNDESYWNLQSDVTGIRGNIGDSQTSAWADINADGRVDFLHYEEGDAGNSTIEVTYNESDNSGFRFGKAVPLSLPKIFKLHPDKIFWADLNGDQLPDIVRYEGDGETEIDQLAVNLNKGHGHFDVTEYRTIEKFKDLKMPRIADINGDGIADLVVGDANSNIIIYLANGSKTYMRYDPLIDASTLPSAASFDVGDINANGSNDMLIGTVGGTIYAHDPYFGMQTKHPFLLTEVSTELGGRTQYTYAAASRGKASSVRNYPVTQPVVTSIEKSAPSYDVNGQYRLLPNSKSLYSFDNGAYDIVRNEFVGFKTVRQRNYHRLNGEYGEDVRYEYYTNEENYYLKGLLKSKDVLLLSNGEKVKSDNYTYVSRNIFDGTGIRAITLKSESSRDFERDRFLEKSSVYCTKMDPTYQVPLEKTSTEFHNGKVIRSVKTKFHAATKNWLIGHVTEQRLFGPQSGDTEAMLIGKQFKYNQELCKLETVEDLRDDGTFKQVVHFEFDIFGNPATVTDAIGNISKAEFRDPGAFLPTSVSKQIEGDAFQILSAEYDYTAGGRLSAFIDENLTRTEIHYDGLGRVQSWRTPNTKDQETLRFEYVWGTAETPSLIKTFSKGINRETLQLLDGNLKEIGNAVPTRTGYRLDGFVSFDLNSQAKSSAERIVLSSTNISKLSIHPSSISTTTYDERGRQLSKDSPAFKDKRAESKNVYSIEGEVRRTTSSNGEGNVKYTDTDAEGRVIKTSLGIKEPVVLSFLYDAANRIINLMSSNEGARTYSWSRNSKIKALRDPNTGSTQYEYDDLDRLVGRYAEGIDGKSEAKFFKYDGLGRLLEERISRSGKVSSKDGFESAQKNFVYTYDLPALEGMQQNNLKGRVSSMRVFPGATYYYSYDDNGNKTAENLYLYDKVFTNTFGYDALDRLTFITYPDKIRYQLSYDPDNGLQTSLDEIIKGTTYGDLNDVTALQGTNYHEQFEYDEVSGLLVSQNFVAGEIHSSKSYKSYDMANRLTGLESSGLDFDTKSRSLTYDDRGFLSQAKIKLSSNLKPESNVSFDQNYAYDSNGNVLKSDLTELLYSSSSAGYSITSKVNQSDQWQFDGLGRLTSAPGLSKVKWSSADRLACLVTSDGSRALYEFLADGTRFTEVTKVGGSKRSRVFINKYVEYDLEAGKYKKYFYFGDRRIAVEIDGKVRYLLNDQVQSPEAEIEGTDLKAAKNFLPYGLAVAKTGTPANSFGFAGSLSTDTFPLEQMGTRFYDSRIGRFVSADMYYLERPWECGSSPVECNVYSYARNNPILFSDPKGEYVDDAGGIHIGPVSPYINVNGGTGNQYQDMTAFNLGLPGRQYSTYEGQNTFLNRLATDLPFDLLLGGIGTAITGLGRSLSKSGATELVHLTDSVSAGLIRDSGKLIGNSYAGPASNATQSTLVKVLRTGISPNKTTEAITISGEATKAFSKVVPTGPLTGLQRMLGHQYTAKGTLDLTTGAFTRTGVNWNQVGFHSADFAIGVGAGVAAANRTDK